MEEKAIDIKFFYYCECVGGFPHLMVLAVVTYWQPPGVGSTNIWPTFSQHIVRPTTASQQHCRIRLPAYTSMNLPLALRSQYSRTISSRGNAVL
jgi:hypothetical protein